MGGCWVPVWGTLLEVSRSCRKLVKWSCKAQSSRCKCAKASLTCTDLGKCKCRKWLIYNVYNHSIQFPTVETNSYTVSLYCITEKLNDMSVSCIATHSYNIFFLWWNRDRAIWFNTQLIGLSGLCCKQTHKMCSLVTTHIYVILWKTTEIKSSRKS